MIKTLIQFVVVFVPTSLVMLGAALVRIFGVQDISNIISTLSLPGLFEVNYLIIPTIIKIAIIFPAIYSVLIIMVFNSRTITTKTISYLTILVVSVLFGLKLFIGNIDVGLSAAWTDFFDSTYSHATIDDAVASSEKLNLVLITVESLESRYLDDNILKELDDSTQFMETLDINNILNSYTIGSIVSTSCGTPLFLAMMRQNNSIASPLTKINCLADFLKSNNYKSESIIPHSRKFSGIGDFYTVHVGLLTPSSW